MLWTDGEGRKVEARAAAGGGFLVCLPLQGSLDEIDKALRQAAAGQSVWFADEMIRLALEGFSYDPVCPRVLARAAGEAAARARLAQMDGRPCAVLFADMDGFKNFNEVLGHAHGDHALRLAAAVFRNRIQVEDPLWRVGDEFCALLGGTDVGTAERLALEIAAEVAGLELGGQRLSVTIAVAPTSADDFPAQLNCSSLQMLRGKRRREPSS